MTNTLTVPISESQIEIARVIARARQAGHEHTRKPSEDLGTGNFAADLTGALGELAVIQALEAAGFRPKGYTLVGMTAPRGPDFTINDVRFSVKTAALKSGYLYWNERQRVDPDHAVDYLIPLSFADNRHLRVHAPIPADQVATWRLMEGRSPYRSIPLDKLEPLGDLTELPC